MTFEDSQLPPVRQPANSKQSSPPSGPAVPRPTSKNLPAPLTQPYSPQTPQVYAATHAVVVEPQHAGVGTQPYNPQHANPYQQSPQAGYQPQHAYPKPEERTLGWLLFGFDGRIPRRLYWYVALALMPIGPGVFLLFLLVAAIVGGMAGVVTFGVGLVVTLLLWVPLTWISIAVQVKRWHDLNKPGVWVLIMLIPCAGPIWVLIECGCTRGTWGPNLYGPDPT